MGRGGSRGKGKSRGGKSTSTSNLTTGEFNTQVKDRWDALPETNIRFEKFYRDQGIIPDEEWPAFLAALHEPLPTTFRINGSRPIAASLNKMIEDVYVPFLSGLEYDGIQLLPPKALDWYPQGYAWQLNVAKQHIRKNEAFRKFQSFLVYETDAGNLSRQEAVSMLPPLLLDVKPSHLVLDMCAAPGSKSAQLLESLHTSEIEGGGEGVVVGPTIPTGCLIANDSDAKRCHMLVHQSLHRIPAASMMVTNHDATQLPGLRLPIPPIEGANPDTKVPKWKAVLYDRILADVPCSGDGTMRKNLMIWRDWSNGNGSGLHALQLRILLRGIALLKPGGRLVYSTCSMNPIENEAVVSAALALSPSMSLLDVPELLPTLIRRPGLTTWKVYDSSNNLIPDPSLPLPPLDLTSEIIEESTTTGETKKKTASTKNYAKTQWPNGLEKERGLNRCWRIYPHLQDTGGFFVAVLVKAVEPTSEVEVTVTVGGEGSKRLIEEEEDLTEVETKRVKIDESVVVAETAAAEVVEVPAAVVPVVAPAVVAETAVAMKGIAEFKEEPVTFLVGDHPEIQSCIDFFELNDSFPRNELLVRNTTGQAARTMYLSSPIVKSLLTSNSHARMRVISCGVKVFTKQDNNKNDETYPCKWRIMTEGLEIIRPFMGEKRLVKCTMSILRILIKGFNIKFEEFELEGEFFRRLSGMENGSCILEILEEEGGEENSETTFARGLTLPLWKSKVSVNLMVEKMDKSALSLRLYGEDITPNVKPPARNLPSTLTVAGTTTATTGTDAPVPVAAEAELEVEVVAEAEADKIQVDEESSVVT